MTMKNVNVMGVITGAKLDREARTGFLFLDSFTSSLTIDKKKETVITREIEAFEVPRDIRKAAMEGKKQELVTLIEKKEELDVPEFMKNYKEKRGIKPRGKVIKVDFGKKEEETDPVLEAMDRFEAGVKKVFRPVTEFFFPETKQSKKDK